MASNQPSGNFQSIGTDVRGRSHEPTGSSGRGEKGANLPRDAPPLDEEGQPGTLLGADWWMGRARGFSTVRLDPKAASCEGTEGSEPDRKPQRNPS